MPELPDVELQRRFVGKHAVGRRFEEVATWDATKVLTGTTTPELQRGLRGTEIVETERLGKYLLCFLSSRERVLILHFGMTGYLAYLSGGELYVAGGAESGGGERRLPGRSDLPEKTKGRFTFADGSQLAFVNMRLLGSIFLIKDLPSFRRTHEIGPDALSLSREGASKAR